MTTTARRTFNLPAEQAAFIDGKVASGAHASGYDVMRAGVRALQERDAVVEDWLRDEVAETYDATIAAPGQAVSADRVTAALRARHADREKKTAG